MNAILQKMGTMFIIWLVLSPIASLIFIASSDCGSHSTKPCPSYFRPLFWISISILIVLTVICECSKLVETWNAPSSEKMRLLSVQTPV